MLRLLFSPVFVTTVSWVVSFSVFIFAVENGSNYEYFEYMVNQEGLRNEASIYSFFLLFVSFGFFCFGTFLSAFFFRPPKNHLSANAFIASRPTTITPLKWIFVATACIAFAWVGGAVLQVGGVGRLAELAASENTAARDLLVRASFPGGRLIASGFIGLTVLCATYLPHVNKAEKKTLLLMIAFGLLYLGIMPILVSGRINFFVAIIGSVCAYTLSTKKGIRIKYLLLALPPMALVWGAKQFFTLGHVVVAQDMSATEQGMQGLLFYFYNDVLNAINSFQLGDGAMTLGWYSLRFIYFMTFTDKFIMTFIYDQKQIVDTWLTAGEVPLLAAPYVDFGIMGVIVLVFFGFFCQTCFKKAACNIGYCSIYGLCFSGLVLSTHSSFITSQEVVYSMIISFLCHRLCVKFRSNENLKVNVNRKISTRGSIHG